MPVREKVPPLTIFVSYAREDARYRAALVKHLGLLKRANIVDCWHDRLIQPGKDWDAEIRAKLDAADVILFLVSVDFFNSDYIDSVEVARAMERRIEGVELWPILVRPLDYEWEGCPFSDLSALPLDRNGNIKSVFDFRSMDLAFRQVSIAIRAHAAQRAATAHPEPVVGGPQSGQRTRGFLNGKMPKRTRELLGREPFLERLTTLFAERENGGVVALTGSGGVGKTSVAVEYVWRARDKYDLVAWITADERTSLASDYAGAASLVGIPGTDHLAARTAFVDWLSDHGRWLLIFDNAAEPDVIRSYLPERPRGHVLITSREPVWEEFASQLSVDRLELYQAMDYLLLRSGDNDEDAAAELAALLRGLPRALENAAADIQQNRLTLRDYIPQARAKLEAAS